MRNDDGKVYGPADGVALAGWAKDGRLQPSAVLSEDRVSWSPASRMADLGMEWVVETAPGRFFGPFHREVVRGFYNSGELDAAARVYHLHADGGSAPIEKVVEKVVVKEVPVEKVVEKVVVREVPVEKVVEKVVRVEVPVEKPEVVEAEVVEPRRAPARPMTFGDAGRDRLAALEIAARRELASARGCRVPFNLLGGKR